MAEKVSISHDFADRIIANDRLTVDPLRIKYLTGAADKSGVIIQDDATRQADLDNEMIYLGAGVGVIGMLGSAGFFLIGRRRSEQQPA